jgi:hypothetical protein
MTQEHYLVTMLFREDTAKTVALGYSSSPAKMSDEVYRALTPNQKTLLISMTTEVVKTI